MTFFSVEGYSRHKVSKKLGPQKHNDIIIIIIIILHFFCIFT
jgi:hypothetical protein